MNDKTLPKKVYLGNAIEELGLTGRTTEAAVHTLYLYFQHDGLPFYFDDSVIGTVADHDLELTSNSELLIGNGYSDECSHGEKRVLEAFPATTSRGYHICASKFQYKGVTYYPCDEAGMILKPYPLDLLKVYFDRHEIVDFQNRLDGGITEKKPASEINFNKGEFKALALLAREMAESKTKYALNGKVNAHSVMTHLLQLSNEHCISKHGLRKIDDKINKALEHHDLKHLGK